jgi:hypothetical protein
MINYTIPQRTTPLTESDGTVNLYWYQFFSGLVPGKSTPEVSITVGSSPFSYTSSDDGFVIVTGGTVSSITILRSSSAQSVATTTGHAIPIGRGDVLAVTYSVKPTMLIYPV